MSVKNSLAVVVAFVAVVIAVSGCTTIAGDPLPAPTATSASEPAVPTSTAEPEPIDVDPAAFGFEDALAGVVYSGVHFTNAERTLACSVWDAEVTGLQWGCRLGDDPWQWSVPIAEEDAAALGEFCASGCLAEGVLAVGAEAPRLRIFTDPGIPSVLTLTMPDEYQVGVLEAGHRVLYSGIECVAEGESISCSDLASGHRFTASATSVTIG